MKKRCVLLFIFNLLTVSLIAQGAETFSNHNLTSNYSNGSYVGDNGVIWNYSHARNKNSNAARSPIDGKAILLKTDADTSAIWAQSGANGVGEITIKHYKGFTGAGARSVEVFINGTSYGKSVDFDDYTHTFTVTGINVPRNAVIEIKNATSKQIIITSIVWSKNGATLSAEPLNKTESFSIYPNPTSTGFVNIKSATYGTIVVSVFDVLGKQVISTTVNNNRLNVSSLNAGVYIIQLNQNGVLSTKKLIVK